MLRDTNAFSGFSANHIPKEKESYGRTLRLKVSGSARALRVYDEEGNVIETHEHRGDFKEWSAITFATSELKTSDSLLFGAWDKPRFGYCCPSSVVFGS